MTITEIYDRYYDKIDEKDLSKLEDMINAVPARNYGDKNPIDDFNKITWFNHDNPMTDDYGKAHINVWHVCWKSFKKIFYVTTQDESG